MSSKASTKDPLLCSKPYKIQCGTTKLTICLIVSQQHEVNPFFCADLLLPFTKCNHILNTVLCHCPGWEAQWLCTKRQCCNRHCQSANHLRMWPPEEEGGRAYKRDCLKLNRSCLQLPGHKRLTNNANMRMHTNEQPRQWGYKQELMNTSHLCCSPMSSLKHLFGELIFLLGAKQRTKKTFNICSDQSKREGEMPPTAWLICIHMGKSARILSNNS